MYSFWYIFNHDNILCFTTITSIMFKSYCSIYFNINLCSNWVFMVIPRRYDHRIAVILFTRDRSKYIILRKSGNDRISYHLCKNVLYKLYNMYCVSNQLNEWLSLCVSYILKFVSIVLLCTNGIHNTTPPTKTLTVSLKFWFWDGCQIFFEHNGDIKS